MHSMNSIVCDQRLKTGDSSAVKATLAMPDVHQNWETLYRTQGNSRFYELAMDKIVNYLEAPRGSAILDAGCGNCSHSIRLAQRGFHCYSVDFSPERLSAARINVNNHNLQNLVTISREDLTYLSLSNNSMEYIFCWGVLMHIPDMPRAVSELCRVLKPGGQIVIQEDNMYSLQGLLPYVLRKVSGNDKLNKTPAGIEYWIDTTAGPLIVRKANMGFLINLLKQNGVDVKERWPGQFTEAYTHLAESNFCKLVHWCNEVWFRYIHIPQLAFGNILIGEKK